MLTRSDIEEIFRHLSREQNYVWKMMKGGQVIQRLVNELNVELDESDITHCMEILVEEHEPYQFLQDDDYLAKLGIKFEIVTLCDGPLQGNKFPILNNNDVAVFGKNNSSDFLVYRRSSDPSKMVVYAPHENN